MASPDNLTFVVDVVCGFEFPSRISRHKGVNINQHSVIINAMRSGSGAAALKDGFVECRHECVANYASLFGNRLGYAVRVWRYASNVFHYTILPNKSVNCPSSFCQIRIANNGVGRVKPERNTVIAAGKRAEIDRD